MNIGVLWELAGEIMVLLCGIMLTLYAFRILGVAKPGDEKYEQWEAWHAKYGLIAKFVGPFLILFTVVKIGSAIMPHL